MNAPSPQINPARLSQSLEDLGRIGAYADPHTGLVGVNRLALTPADGEGRGWVVARMHALGLEVEVDGIGNVRGRRAGTEDLPGVMLGSHIDSVPTGGRYDGALGVLGGLEVVAALNDAGIATRRPIVVGFFTDEEGCRFGTDMIGSAVATGRIGLEQALNLRDADGVALGEALDAIGWRGSAPVRLDPPHAYLECHVEQGPVLAAAGVDLGVVSGVQGISWQEWTIHGAFGHAGATPMELRRDAGLAAARLNLWLRELCERVPGTRATMGAIAPEPGLVNIVPGRVRLTVDLRNPDEARLREAEATLETYAIELAVRDRVQIERRQTARTAPVAFDPGIQARIAAAAAARGCRTQPITSGAGHDAQEMARICPTGMVFVPGMFDGISHNPREYSTPEACAAGVRVLLDVARTLAEEP